MSDFDRRLQRLEQAWDLRMRQGTLADLVLHVRGDHGHEADGGCDRFTWPWLADVAPARVDK